MPLRFLPQSRSRAARCALALVVALSWFGCAVADPEKDKLRHAFLPRWDTNEVPYADAPLQDKIGRNIRDGIVGIIDDVAQGAFSVFLIGPTTGFIVQKLGTMGGDVVGLIDDNDYTEHVFKGILSRQFLKFGAQARTFTTSLGGIHTTTFHGPEFQILDYVGDETFHTKVYGAPSGITTLIGVVAADFLIRPAGNFILIFGARGPSEKVDKFGLDVIQLSTEVPFL